MVSLHDQTSFFHIINHMFIQQRSITRGRSCPYPSLLAMSTYFHKHFKILQKVRIISLLTGKSREQLKAVYSLKVHISYMIRIKQKMSKSTNSQVMCLSQNRQICPVKNENTGPFFQKAWKSLGQPQQSINKAWGPTKCRTLCDPIGHTPMKLVLLAIGGKVAGFHVP